MLLISCTVRYSPVAAEIPAKAQTFSVGAFPARAPLAGPNVSISFVETLKDLMLQQTRLDLEKKNGDLKFEGAITGYAVQPVAIQGDETSALNRLTITVTVRYTNSFDREKNFELNFSRFADYDSSRNLADVEEVLIVEINDQLVQDIFDRSLGNW
jgi:hypothetical protein